MPRTVNGTGHKYIYRTRGPLAKEKGSCGAFFVADESVPVVECCEEGLLVRIAINTSHALEKLLEKSEGAIRLTEIVVAAGDVVLNGNDFFLIVRPAASVNKHVDSPAAPGPRDVAFA